MDGVDPFVQSVIGEERIERSQGGPAFRPDLVAIRDQRHVARSHRAPPLSDTPPVAAPQSLQKLRKPTVGRRTVQSPETARAIGP